MQVQKKQSMIILAVAGAAAVLLLLALQMLSSHVSGSDDEEPQDEPLHVSMLTSDSTNDQSWGALAYESKLHLEERFDTEVAFYPHLTTKRMRDFRISREIEQGCDIIIGHGSEFSDIFSLYAEEHPDVTFVTLHGDSDQENYTVYTFDITDAEKTALHAASMKSETGRIGVISMEGDWHAAEAVYEEAGRLDADTDILLETVVSRNDREEALRAMRSLKAQGVDVIYTRGNQFNRYIISEMEQEDMYAVGFVEDQSMLAENHVLTSVTQHIPQIYEIMMEDYLSDEGLPGGVRELEIEDGAYGVAPLGPMYTDAEKAAVKRYQEQLKQRES
ncbi:BMP family ABC transporter substrate-binding protein [Alkalicoccus chagannorensis]|uniref:BMP family ABC transporter substrate-binding protein n=1 Tax=Alkalicoccus chagannorensis TaxID=427072 RepID=UPI00040916EF|nr:BMP family ABC transporter substrate-binding protein [Alkalicoccus chagannorensis]